MATFQSAAHGSARPPAGCSNVNELFNKRTSTMGEHVYKALNRIMVWKFDAAPAHFQRLHHSSLSPEWMVLVPCGMYQPDIDRAIMENGSIVNRYVTENKDVIYVGNAQVQLIPALQLRDELETD